MARVFTMVSLSLSICKVRFQRIYEAVIKCMFYARYCD